MHHTDRRRVLSCLLAGTASATMPARAQHERTGSDVLHNPLLWALAWKQTAAEFFALCHQAYNLAHMRVDGALAERTDRQKPLAVIADMDDTILHAQSYWGYLVNENRDFFDDAIWDEWLPRNLVTAVPGALDFFRYCADAGVEIFYVTNRDQGERTYEYALAQLRHLEFPFADADHLTVFRDTSDKTPARDRIAATHEIAVILGDNLNDYKRDYYVRDIDERLALMERDREDWGRKFILLPNPTDGHWVRAIFGESEPEPTDENRRKLWAAAARTAWEGR